jgi:hypothetical protein
MILWLFAISCFVVELTLSHLMSPLLSFILLASTVFALWKYVAGRYGTWHPASIYIAVSSLYVFSPLGDSVLLGNALRFDIPRMKLLAELGCGFVLAASLGMSLIPTTDKLDAIKGEDSRQRMLVCIVALAVLLTLLEVVAVQRSYGLRIGELTRAELYLNENVFLTLLRNVLVVVLLISLAALRACRGINTLETKRARILLLGCIGAFCLLDLLILGDRRASLVLILGAAALFSPRNLSYGRAVALTLLAIVLLLLGLVRNTPVGEWLDVLTSPEAVASLSPAAQEFGSLAIVGGSIEDLWSFPEDFPTYADAFSQLLPQAISGTRPMAPSEWFVWTYYPSVARLGASFAFNGVVEAIGNGGILGIVIVGMLTGVLISLVSRLGFSSAPVGIPIALFIFTFSMRMEFASMLRNAIYCALAIGLVAAWIMLLSRPPRRNLRARELVVSRSSLFP